jgi:hypothetical protein
MVLEVKVVLSDSFASSSSTAAVAFSERSFHFAFPLLSPLQ